MSSCCCLKQRRSLSESTVSLRLTKFRSQERWILIEKKLLIAELTRVMDAGVSSRDKLKEEVES